MFEELDVGASHEQATRLLGANPRLGGGPHRLFRVPSSADLHERVAAGAFRHIDKKEATSRKFRGSLCTQAQSRPSSGGAKRSAISRGARSRPFAFLVRDRARRESGGGAANSVARERDALPG